MITSAIRNKCSDKVRTSQSALSSRIFLGFELPYTFLRLSDAISICFPRLFVGEAWNATRIPLTGKCERCGVRFMYLMSTSMVLCGNLLCFRDGRSGNESPVCEATGVCDFTSKRRRIRVFRLVPAAKRGHVRKRPWWEKLFSEESDDVPSSLKLDDVLGDIGEAEEVSEDDKFEAWKRRAEAITELREAQEDARNAEAREWEDWIGDGSGDAAGSSWDHELGGEGSEAEDEVSRDPYEIMREKGFDGVMRNLIAGKSDDELLFEDRVFLFASTSSVCESILLICIISS